MKQTKWPTRSCGTRRRAETKKWVEFFDFGYQFSRTASEMGMSAQPENGDRAGEKIGNAGNISLTLFLFFSPQKMSNLGEKIRVLGRRSSSGRPNLKFHPVVPKKQQKGLKKRGNSFFLRNGACSREQLAVWGRPGAYVTHNDVQKKLNYSITANSTVRTFPRTKKRDTRFVGGNNSHVVGKCCFPPRACTEKRKSVPLRRLLAAFPSCRKH